MRLLLLLPFLFAGRASFALVVEPTAVESQLKNAPLVVEISVLAVKGAADREGSLSYQAQVRVDRVLEAQPDGGDFPAEGDTILLRGLGGEANGMGEYLTGYARPRVGRRYQAHLVRQGADFAVTGFEFGLIAIDGLREFSRNRTDGSNSEGTGAFLYWAKNYLPVTYAISAKSFVGFADYIAAIDASFQAWQSPAASRMAFLAVGCSEGARNTNDGINHVILITDSWPYDPAAIAITRNFYLSGDSPQSGMILDSDILLNGVDHHFTTSPVSGQHDVQNIVTHEVGHFIGLGHEISPFDSEATMYAQASPSELKKRQLKESDKNGLYATYAGTGEKITPSSAPSCQIRDASATSCLAAHQPHTPTPRPVWMALLATWILLVRFAGRRIHLINNRRVISN